MIYAIEIRAETIIIKCLLRSTEKRSLDITVNYVE